MQFQYLPLLENISSQLQTDSFWNCYLDELKAQNKSQVALHLAILVEPYLQFILDGEKTVESRFSINRCAPYKKVHKGDIVLLKRSGGPVIGICKVSSVWFYELDPDSWKMIRKEFTQALCAQDPAFWKEREAASYATLMRVQHVRPLTPIPFTKRDRRGWVVLKAAEEQLTLDKF